MIVYDCEIEKGILGRDELPLEGIEYCRGWKDFGGMGISCIGAYDYLTDQYRVFCRDNFNEFEELADCRQAVIGFNSIAFDNPLLAANGIEICADRAYDVLVEVWIAAGLGPTFEYPTHLGFGLEQLCQANLGIGKTGHGAQAPVLWQTGKIGSVIDYCLRDVWLTKKLVDLIDRDGCLKDPRDPSKTLTIRRPEVP